MLEFIIYDIIIPLGIGFAAGMLIVAFYQAVKER
jgi:hypothetical protein